MQRLVKRDLNTVTSFVVGVGLLFNSVALNSTPISPSIQLSSLPAYYSHSTRYEDKSSSRNRSVINNHRYIRPSKRTDIENEAYALFGTMRDATPEERAQVYRYIESISVDTGVNFFDLC